MGNNKVSNIDLLRIFSMCKFNSFLAQFQILPFCGHGKCIKFGWVVIDEVCLLTIMRQYSLRSEP